MIKHQTTIKDIARKLRISVSTVSRALRNLPDVNAETKKDVLEMAEKLNYEPNYIAKSLINKKTHVIGVIVPLIASSVFSRMLMGMYNTAQLYDYQLMICQSNENAQKEAALIKQLVSFKVDGVIVSVSSQTKNDSAFEILNKKEIPYVFFDRILPIDNISKVTIDEPHSVSNAIQHLIDSGCRRIAHIGGPPNLSISQDRLKGYLTALEKYKIPIDEDLILHCNSFDDDPLINIAQLFAHKPFPDGVFTINDYTGVATIKYLESRAINVPQKVSVIGFNNDPISRVVSPSLTTINIPCNDIGITAIELLIKKINMPSSPAQSITLHSNIIIRDSTA